MPSLQVACYEYVVKYFKVYKQEYHTILLKGCLEHKVLKLWEIYYTAIVD